MQLIVCCDGTWNDPDDGTHIHRICQAGRAALPDPDNVFYGKGVGLEPGMRLSGGAWARASRRTSGKPTSGSSVATPMAPRSTSSASPAAPIPHVRSPAS